MEKQNRAGQSSRPAASRWIATTIVSLTFSILAHDFGQGTPFGFFNAVTVLQLIVVGFFYPEAKGRTLEQLQRQLEDLI